MPLHGRHQSPQRIASAITAGMLSSLQDDPGLRVGSTTKRSSSTFSGGGLIAQRFLRAPTGPNHPDTLQVAPVSINARRALNRQRGYPGEA